MQTNTPNLIVSHHCVRRFRERIASASSMSTTAIRQRIRVSIARGQEYGHQQGTDRAFKCLVDDAHGPVLIPLAVDAETGELIAKTVLTAEQLAVNAQARRRRYRCVRRRRAGNDRRIPGMAESEPESVRLPRIGVHRRQLSHLRQLDQEQEVVQLGCSCIRSRWHRPDVPSGVPDDA